MEEFSFTKTIISKCLNKLKAPKNCQLMVIDKFNFEN